jgi:serine protease
MKKLLLLLLCFLSVAVFGQQHLQGNSRVFKLAKGLSEKDYLPNTIIIKFKSGSTVSQIKAATSILGSNTLNIKSANLKQVNQLFKNSLKASAVAPSYPVDSDTIGIDRIYEVKYSATKGIEDIINETLQNPLVEYAEPSYIYHTNYIPNDQLYSGSQSYLRQIKADQAWDIIRNSAGSVIAIVDSGTDLDHVDLKANILLPGKDLVGASFTTMIEDNDPDVKSDSADHGVRVSGIASAVSDNGIGITSTAFNAKLLIVKVGADNNATAIYKGYEGIKYAADNGANIINCSWGGAGGGSYGQDIINYAISKGCLVVAAAGNEGSAESEYPALYTGVLAVASVDNADRRSSFSNYGSHVTISAPGEIYTTANRNNYTIARGTSFSTPLVSSAAALVKARFPAFDMTQVKEQLRVTADNIDALNPNYVGLLGKGRLNVYRAVSETPPSVRSQKMTLVDKGKGSIPPGDTLRIFFDLKNFLSPATGLTVKLSSSNPDVQIIDETVNIGSLGTLQTQTMVGAFRVYIKPGISDNEEVTFKLTYSANSAYTDTEQFTIRVALDYLNIQVNQVATTLSSNGRVGFSGPEETNGIGFIYKDDQLLYEASLMIGNSAFKVSNNARNDAGGADNHFAKKVRVGKVDDAGVAFKGVSEFDDSRNANRLNIYVKHSQVAFAAAPDDKYTIAEYEIQNTGSTVLNGVYAGMFTDWDVDASGHDVTKYDAANRLAYVFGKSAGTIYAGVKLLSTSAAPAYYPMTQQLNGDPLQSGGGFSLAEKYQALSSGIKSTGLGEATATGYDVTFVSGYGPYTIPASGSIKVAFAFLAGDNLTDLQASAIAAQKKYDTILQTGPLMPEDGFILGQNYPNPAFDQTSISFSIAESTETSLTLYNTIGQPVRELVNANLPKGTYTITVDLTDLEAGVYFYKMQYKGKEKTLKLLVTK